MLMRYVKIVAILFFIAVATQGCDLFSTRTPEPPDVANAFIWTPTTSLEYLIQNFKGTVQVVDASNYIRLFITSDDSVSSTGIRTYQFIPRAGLDQTSQAVFSLWTVDQEKAYLTKLRGLLPKNPRIGVELTNIKQQFDLNAATLSADYALSIPSETDAIPSSVSGTLQFELELVTTEQGTKEWRIQRWTDNQLPNNTGLTWTDLKLKLSS